MISAILVHYRVPDLAAEAVEALLADCRRSGLSCEVLLVDNGSCTEDRDRLRRLPVKLLVPEENLGYAGGLAHGVEASRGDVLLLMNPDVLVRAGCIAALVRALESGTSAAGPRFYWDRGRTLLLPPAEERNCWLELLGRLAPRAEPAARALRRRWRAHARRHWDASAPFPSESLSGALLAVQRAAWDAVGPFDPGYRLYYEETDWLCRLTRAGAVAVHVPEAEAVHLYDRSASVEPRSAAWFRESRRRFERRWYGLAFSGLLTALDRMPSRAAGPSEAPSAPNPPVGAPTVGFEVPTGLRLPLWLEISPSPYGVPAAGQRISPAGDRLTWSLPDEVWERLSPGGFRLQLVDARGIEGPCRWLHKSGPSES